MHEIGGALVDTAHIDAIQRALVGLLVGYHQYRKLGRRHRFAGATAIVIAIALAASFVPAWRASRVDPLAALRRS